MVDSYEGNTTRRHLRFCVHLMIQLLKVAEIVCAGRALSLEQGELTKW